MNSWLLPKIFAALLTILSWPASQESFVSAFDTELEGTVVEKDTAPPLRDRDNDFVSDPNYNPYDLKDPSAIKQEVKYDPETGRYIITERIGDEYYRSPTSMSFREYQEYKAKQQERDYFKNLAGLNDGKNKLNTPSILDPVKDIDLENLLIDRLFGGTDIEIKPRGNIDLTFGYDYQRVLNPNIPIRAQRQGIFDFDMDINMSVEGRIGKKLNLNFNYNTGAAFNFDNQINIDYNSAEFSEDDILQRIEAGNVSLPQRNSLIQGSESLLGILAEWQFGRLRLTTLVSQQRSRQQQITLDKGAQVRRFEVFADQYDEFRHFFLSHYNRNVFERALQDLPLIRSQFKIKRLEVYITNDRQEFQDTRDVVAIADLGTPSNFTMRDSANFKLASPPNFDPSYRLPLPGRNIVSDRSSNGILDELERRNAGNNAQDVVRVLQSQPFNMEQGRDFEKINARKLSPSEYEFHPELGFISLRSTLRADQVVGVAYEYDFNGKTYRVGQFSNEHYDGDSLGVLFVKMLKGTTPNVSLPLWDLMMKNVYSIGAYNAGSEDFYLDVFYDDPGAGQKRFLPIQPDQPLLQTFNLDNLNVQRDPSPDGVFDFIPGLTIFPRTGRMMFPVLEPFGSSLSKQLPDDPEIQNQYVYQVLYDSTVWRAREYPALNRFAIRGQFKSSISREISLGAFNLPEGSVVVRAGGQILREGIDYTVNYSIGQVIITNDAFLTSGVPINISFEDNTLFGIQQQTLLGLRADYMASKKLNLGATYMHLFERPFTAKVNIGDDPISNRVYGFDLNYNSDAPWLTKLVDGIPFIDTKAPSSISLTSEFAMIDPGSARAIKLGDDREASVYLDDFEGSTTSDDLRLPTTFWVLSSVPQGDNQFNRFPESALINDRRSNANRAKLSWYRTDLTLRTGEDEEDPYARLVRQREIFPNIQIPPNQRDIINTLDVTYYPQLRGPYNFDPPDGTEFSAGLELSVADSLIRLKEPETRWAGMMREVRNTDFEQANYEFIEIWMLNPFMGSTSREGIAEDGELYFNLGNISEDVLRDSRSFFEDGLPVSPDEPTPDTTNLGVIPRKLSLINAFDQEEANRIKQDVGFDGMDNALELQEFADYVSAVQNSGSASPALLNSLRRDPANDDYTCFRDEGFTNVFDRYFNFNNSEGNSPVTGPDTRLPCNATARPDREDINRDNSLNETEAYYEYKIPIRRGPALADGTGFEMDISSPDIKPYVTDTVVTGGSEIWYRLKIPIDQYDRRIGNIRDFRSIRFMRMYMTGFERKTTFRFARLELVRSQWRRYRLNDLRDPTGVSDGLPIECGDFNSSSFDINDVNIEENSGRTPFNYVLPNSINREQGLGAFPDALQNEQALSLSVCNLPCKGQKAVYKNVGNFNMNVYKRMHMFVHAEVTELGGSAAEIEDGDASLFIRLGSDFTRNFYEYEIPLTFSQVENIMGRDNNDPEYIDEVWRLENELDFPLELFRDLKKARNENGQIGEFFSMPDPDNPEKTVSIIGNPGLGIVKSIMIGVRSKSEETFGNKCIEVWVNELRLSGLDDRTAFATSNRIDMTLADFGSINAEANYSTIGYGSISQKVNERNREELISYSFTGQANFGQFFPQKASLTIPFIFQHFQETANPEYDPYDLDIRLKDKLAEADSRQERDSIRQQAQDFNRITSIGFNNVQKGRTAEGIPLPWDISNFAFTYVYTNNFRRNPIIAFEDQRVQLARIDYRYQIKPLVIRPFAKLIKKDKYFKWLSQLNFNPIPNSVEFTNEMERSFATTKYRFTGTEEETPSNTFFNKYFTWDRFYRVNWKVADNLSIDYSAVANAVIDEPLEFNNNNERISNQTRQDSIWENIKDLGRPKNYSQNLNISYTLPTRNIPFLEWTTIKAQYNANYNWSAAPLNLDSLGNVISNGQERQLTGDLNFEQLYNKSKYLRQINRGRSRSRSRRAPVRRGNTNSQVSPDDDDDKKKKKRKDGEPSKLAKAVLRPLMMLRRARLTFREDLATIVPGFLPQPKYLGLSEGFDAPGWGFAFGLQPNIEPNTNDFLRQSANKGWISENYWVTQEVIQSYGQTLEGRITLEPIPDFRIELTARRTYREDLALMFRDSMLDNYTDPSEIVHLTPRENGSFTISYNTLGTLFGSNPKSLFDEFQENRVIISERLDTEFELHEDPNQAINGYREGYGELQQDVLLNAYLATYTKKDPNSIDLLLGKDDFRNMMPRMNWNIQYNGLSRVKGMDKIFSGFNLNHSYQSTLTINNFQTDAEAAFGGENNFNDNFDYYSAYVIPNVLINEQFAPLIGLDMKFKNDMSFGMNFNKNRNLAFSFVDYKLVETQGTSYDFNFGYVIKDFRFALFETKRGSRRRQRKPKQSATPPPGGSRSNNRQQDRTKDLTLQFEFSFGDDRTLVHLLDFNSEPQDTRGSKRVAFSPSAQYELNQQLSLRFFYDYNRTIPYTSNAFPITNWQTGVQVRFTLN